MTKLLENHPWSELRVGDTASISRKCSESDVELFGVISGDLNPSHYVGVGDKLNAPPVAHSMWTASLVSGVIGNELPGPGTVLENQDLSYLAEADAAGIVLGARVPIILTSRADSVESRLASAAVAALLAWSKK